MFWPISLSVLCLKSLVMMLKFTVTVASGCTYCKRTSACWWVRDQVLWNCKFLPESNLFSDSRSSLTAAFCVLQSAKTNLNVEQVFFSIARDIKQRLAETDSKPEVQIIVPVYIWNSIATNDLSDISLLCRRKQSKLTSQTRVPSKQLVSDPLAAAHKRCATSMIIGYLMLFISRLAVIGRIWRSHLWYTWCGCTCVCFHSLKQSPLAVDVAIAIAGSYCTLDFGPLKKISPPYSV